VAVAVVDSTAVVEADSTVVAAEATDNMIAKTFTLVLVVAAGGAWAQTPQAPKSKQKTFDSPEVATQALIDAASKNDTATLAVVLGSSAKGILTSGDPKEDEAEREEFAGIAAQKHHLERSSMDTRVMVLLVGDQDWPFPIPLVQEGKGWRFDSDRGGMEVRARQVGANELEAIEACAAYVGAQEAYASHKRSAAGTVEYAQTIASSPVPKEFADAAADKSTHPYHGYYFRVLTSQGSHAPGGQYPYVVGKTMIGGFALVAWPAAYGVSGVHTFIVNQDGVVYEKDRSAHPAASVTQYDPDPSWTPVD
jgi:hypothetical protein